MFGVLVLGFFFLFFFCGPPFISIRGLGLKGQRGQVNGSYSPLLRASISHFTILFRPFSPSCLMLFLEAFSIRGCVRPSVGPSVGHTLVEFRRNGPNINKIASGIRLYAI